MSKVSWVSIKRKGENISSGGRVYNSEACEVLKEEFEFSKILIPEENLEGTSSNIFSKSLNWLRSTLWQPYPLKNSKLFILNGIDTTVCTELPPNSIQVVMLHHIAKGVSFPTIAHKAFHKLRLKKFYEKMHSVDRVVVVSKYWKKHLESRGIDKITVIHNPFNLKDYVISQKVLQSFCYEYELQDNRVLYLGKVGKGKGIKAVSRALKDLPNTRIIATDPSPNKPTNSDLFQTISLSFKEYIALLHVADIVVTMSTMPEGWCRVAHEAMLCKTPVIGSGAGGMEELLRNGGQIICNDLKKLKPLVVELLENEVKARKIAEEGYKYASQFDLLTFQSKWVNLIRELL